MGKLEIQLKSMRHLFFVGILFFGISAEAQTKKLTNIIGAASIVNISPEEAKVKAIEAAKVEALRLAGAEDWVQSFDYLEKKEEGKNFEEYFHSLTSVQTMGSVTEWELLKEEKKLSANQLIYEVSINATVQLYKTKTDPEFQIAIEGIRNVYKNEDNMTFTVLPKKDGYLKIFLFDNNRNVNMLHPNEHEPSKQMASGKLYTFPQTPHFNYEVYTDRKEETNYFFFLFTRKDVLYKGTTFQDFIQYVYSMEPQDRFVQIEKVVIYR
jgi:hypothetical protein